MMRILFLDHEPILAGAELMLLRFLRNFDRKKMSCELVVPRHGSLVDEVKNLGIAVHVVRLDRDLLGIRRKGSTLSISGLFQLAKGVGDLRQFIRQRSFDIVVSNSLKAHVYGSFAMRGRQVPYAWRVHDVIDKRDFSRPQRMLLGFCARTFPCSIAPVSEAASRALEQCGVKPERIRLLHNGIDIPGPIDRQATAALCQRLGLSADHRVVALPGRIVPENGHRTFLAAVGQIVQRIPNARFLIVGEETDAALGFERSLREYVRKEGLEPVVIFTGFQHDMASLYAISDITVQPTEFTDPFPTVILEAMAARSLVIASDAGGAREIIEDGKTGFVIPAVNPHALALKIVEVLSSLPKYEGLRDRAAATIREKYTTKLYVESMERWLAGLKGRS